MRPIKTGNKHTVNLWESTPSLEQLGVYAFLIRSLRDMPGDCVVFEFYKDTPQEFGGLVFIRMCRSGRRIYAEAQVNEEITKLYARSMTEEQAAELVYLDLSCPGGFVNREKWRNITKQGSPKYWHEA